MRAPTRLALLFAFVGAACGGAPPPAPEAAHVQVPPPPASARAPASPAGRGPSEALVKMWPFDKAVSVTYADVAALRRTKIFEPLLSELLGGTLPADTARCWQSLSGTAREALFGAGDSGMILLARFAGDKAPAIAGCLPGARTVALEGAQQAAGEGERVAAVTAGGVLACGARALVARALRAAGPPGVQLVAPLEGDEVLRFQTDPSDGTRTELRVEVSEQHVAFELEETYRTVNDAVLDTSVNMDLPTQFKERFGPQIGGDEEELVGRLTEALHVERRGKRVLSRLDLREPPADQARDVVGAVRGYLITEKESEARDTLAAISKAIAVSWEREDLPGKKKAKKKLVSYPPVPSTVPRGTKYQSSRDDWKAWAPLRFEMAGPQRFQYEVRAAKDGASAQVIARGDLNGDGKTSQYVQVINVDHDQLMLVPMLDETNPEE